MSYDRVFGAEVPGENEATQEANSDQMDAAVPSMSDSETNAADGRSAQGKKDEESRDEEESR